MKFKEAYTAVHNMIHQNEALLALREHLEAAKDAESYLKANKNELEKLNADIVSAKELKNEIEKAIKKRRLDIKAEAEKKNEEFQKKLKADWETYHAERTKHAADLSKEVTEKQSTLNNLITSIEAKRSQEKELEMAITAKQKELKTAQDSLNAIKMSIGG